MKISNFNIQNNSRGFTIVELVVVLAGLAALASFSIPSIFRSVKLNRVEEAKALMNSYAADCLSKYRLSTNPVDFIENSTPDQLDDIKLSTLQYKIDGDKNKCSHLAIKPLNENEKDLFSFDFRMTSDGEILKTAKPSDNPSFLNSCRSWAGTNCGLSEAQKAEFARLAALAKAKSECISNYLGWLNAGNSGEFVTWDNDNESCSRSVFAFEGTPVNSAEAVEQAQQAKYGLACAAWRLDQRNSNTTNKNPLTKTPECGGVNYWFHSGIEFLSQAAWNAHDNQLKEQACIDNRTSAQSQGVEGKYTYEPAPGPSPCGEVVWLCNTDIYTTQSGYETSTCAPPIGGDGDDNDDIGDGGGDKCVDFVKPPACVFAPSHPSCTCKE
tara:strand:+ start:2340 stop:3488 length:1149 start_codon:yes stop_codon:yes gene_type:complete